MNKKLSFVGIILALLLLTINSAFAAGVVDVTGVTSQSGYPGDSKTFTVTVNNTGDAAIATVNLVSSDLVLDATNKILGSSISIPSISSLAVGAPQTTTFTLVIPSKMNGVYNANPGITATDASAPANTDAFAYGLTINLKDNLDVLTYDNATALEIIGEEGETGLIGTFQIKNIGSTNLDLAPADFDTSALDLIDGDNDVITLTFSDPASLSPGGTGTITVTANYGDNIDLDTYGGTLNVKKATVLDSFKLDLKVFPEICSDGIVKDGDKASRATADLQLNVKNPDNGDDFKAGDQISIDVRVDNNGDTDLDVTVEAILYNLDEDEEIETVESDSQEIKDGSEETFEFELEVPRDFDGDENDRYIIFLKAIEDGDEEQNCNFESKNLDFSREKDDVIVKKSTLSPSTAKPGDVVELIVDVENVGKNDQRDAYIQISNTELGISLRSNEFDLDKSGGSDDTFTRRFSVNIPVNAAEKEYTIDVAVVDDNDDTYENGQGFATLTVKIEGGATVTPGIVSGETKLNVVSQTNEIDASKGSANLHLVFTNNYVNDLTAIVDVKTIGDWADPITSQTVSLHPGDNNIYFNLKLKDIEEGTYSASVGVRPAAGSNFEAKTFSLNFDVKGKSAGLSGITGAFTGGSSTVFWIIGDAVLILIALLIVKAVFFRKK